MDVFGFLLEHWSCNLAIIGLVTAVYFYLGYKYSYFEKRGIAHLKPVPFFGNLGCWVFRRKSLYDFLCEYYQKFEGKSFVGFYEFLNPIILVRDPELIKKICVKDFDHFVDRIFVLKSDVNALLHKSLMGLTGEPWREMRNTLTPAFTASKMKAMLGLVDACGQNMNKYLEKKIKEHKPGQPGEPLTLDVKDFFTKYTNDVIATCAFGINCDSFEDPDNVFYKMGKLSHNFDGLGVIVIFGYMVSTKLMQLLNISTIPNKVSKFFRSTISVALSKRERERIVRPDMIHLLMQAKKGVLKAEVSDGVENTVHRKTKSIAFDDETITAQAFLFLLAGFETSSTLMCFAMQLLAMHPEIQDRLRHEVDETTTGEKMTYDTMQGMKYLDCVLSETLRLYSLGAMADRICIKDYVIPATETTPEVTLKKGDGVWIPLCALHRDPKYFPEPLKFDPERFSDENKHNIKPYTYQPFGVGPRNCIGNRFALMEAKISLVHLLSRFSFHVVPKTQLPIQMSRQGFIVKIEGGFWVGIKLRNK